MSAKTQYTSLSDELYKEANTSLVSTSKIGLSYKMINSIGFNMPHVFLNVTKLYLSNNKIRYLNGIEAFKNLTFFSIAFNEIDEIDEFERLQNKGNLVSLAVKGNLFNKNPSANLILIKKFPNLKDLDGYKISGDTIKTIEDARKIRCDIIPFLFVLEENINKLKMILNQILINIEIESRSVSLEAYSDEKIKRINNLLRFHGLINFNTDKIRRYLKKKINPSIYIIRKFIDNFIPCEDYLYKNFNPPDINSVAIIYEKLFIEIIKSYTIKKNYNELPSYLNFLILNSNPILKKFFMQKVKESKDFHEYIRESNSSEKKGLKDCECFQKNKGTYYLSHDNCLVTEMDIIKFACRLFDRYFVEFTNYGIDILIRIQMYFFYSMQPPQAKIINQYKPILEQSQSKFIRFVNDESDTIKCNQSNNTYPQTYRNNNEQSLLRNNITMSEEYKKYHQQVYTELKYKNPFLSRLHSDADIKPKKAKLFNEKSIPSTESHSYYSSSNQFRIKDVSELKLEDANLEIYYENGKEKINLKFYVEYLTNFFCYYSPLEFPVFCLNFDYMRVLTSLLQTRLEDFLTEYGKLDRLYIEIKTNYDDLLKKQISKYVDSKSKEVEKLGKTKKTKSRWSSKTELFQLRSNIYNDNKLLNCKLNEFNNQEINANPEFYADNYKSENFKSTQELDLKEKSTKSPPRNENKIFKDLSVNSNSKNYNFNRVIGNLNNESISDNKNISKIYFNYDKNLINPVNENRVDFIDNNITNKINNRYPMKSQIDSEVMNHNQIEVVKKPSNKSTNKTIYYHTFSNMNSLEKIENKDNNEYNNGYPHYKVFNNTNSDFNNMKGNTDSYNYLNSNGDNIFDKKKFLNPKKEINQNNYYTDIKTSNHMKDPIKINALITPENNINNESLYDFNVNYHEAQEAQPSKNLNIKEKLISNLTNNYNNIMPSFNRKSKINELSTLQSNDFRFGDVASNNGLSVRMSQGPLDISPRFIQSLDSEIGYDYFKKGDKPTSQIYSTINGNELNNYYNSVKLN